ncbi:MAG: hypothetical protein U5L05_10500 [Rubrivivax sp.]|nr:hypothetical protein [Rubrivivax sp.]
MPTIERLPQRPRAAPGWLAALLAAVLAGCGPGVGGTGMRLTLRDGGGRVLLGPVVVTATAAAPGSPVCP